MSEQQQAQPQVGHAHFVEIGEQQGQAQGYPPGIFDDGVDLPAQVAGGPLDAMEEVMVIGTGHNAVVSCQLPVASG